MRSLIPHIVLHPLETLCLTAWEAPMTAARGDVILLGGGYLIPYRPYRGGRTGVVAISPTHEGGNMQDASEIDHIEIGQGLQGLLDGDIHTTVVEQS